MQIKKYLQINSIIKVLKNFLLSYSIFLQYGSTSIIFQNTFNTFQLLVKVK